MPTLLLVNPNTSGSVTALMTDVIRPILGSEVTVVAATARLGASYIASEAAYAVAAHAALDAWAAFREGGGRCDAVLVGCFGDPGIAALREVAGVPVMGLAEAALREAALHGPHAIVTGGAAWRPMLRRFAIANGLDEGLAGIHVVEKSGVELMAMPDGGAGELLGALREAAEPPVRAVVIGGAALGGIAQRVAPQVGVPVIDSVQAGARWAAAVLRAPSALPASIDAGVRWSGVSEALAGALADPGAAGR